MNSQRQEHKKTEGKKKQVTIGEETKISFSYLNPSLSNVPNKNIFLSVVLTSIIRMTH